MNSAIMGFSGMKPTYSPRSHDYLVIFYHKAAQGHELSWKLQATIIMTDFGHRELSSNKNRLMQHPMHKVH